VLQWLQYGYLQQGRSGAARALIDTARAVLAGVDLSSGSHVDARFTIDWLEFMAAAHTGEWSDRICARARESSSMRPPASAREQSFQNVALYHAAVAAAKCGAADGAVIQQLRARADALPQDDPAAPMLRTALLHADAVTAERRGDHARVIELLSASAAAPAQPPVGPPATLRVHELLGAALLQSNRAQEAAAAYERALQLTPKRSLALLGLARARAASGDRAGAADTYRTLLDNWQMADLEPALLAEVRRGAAAQ
jgi:tetratricopeptide (TPR) repeat protein